MNAIVAMQAIFRELVFTLFYINSTVIKGYNLLEEKKKGKKCMVKPAEE